MIIFFGGVDMKNPLNRRLKEKRQHLNAVIEQNGYDLSCETVVRASQELDEVIIQIQQVRKGVPHREEQ